MKLVVPASTSAKRAAVVVDLDRQAVDERRERAARCI
jgi:hypothetical protein